MKNRITQLKRERLNLIELINIYDKEDGSIQDRLKTIDKELNELENIEARQTRINRLKRQRAFYLANSKKKEDMFKLEFIIPLTYAGYISTMMLKYKLFDLNVNTLTLGVYLLNIMVVFILHKVGKVLDKCLEHFF